LSGWPIPISSEVITSRPLLLQAIARKTSTPAGRHCR
jgi:hypothetical protein